MEIKKKERFDFNSLCLMASSLKIVQLIVPHRQMVFNTTKVLPDNGVMLELTTACNAGLRVATFMSVYHL